MSLCIVGVFVLVSAKLVSRSMESTSISLKSDLLKEIKELQPVKPNEMPPEVNLKPGDKIVEGVTAGNSPIKGSVSAPVLMVEFSDLECPFSKRFYKEVFPLIDKEYISTGKVKFAFRDLPLPFHASAKGAAIALRCSAKQNKYWQMFDKLSSNEKVDLPAIEGYAKEIGVNMSSLDKCMSGPAVVQDMENDANEAAKFGAQGTPTFFINGHMIAGALPFEVFKEVIEKELANLSNKK